MNLHYCAWLQDSMGCSLERIVLPEDVRTVGMLLDWLPTRDERSRNAFQYIDVVLVSVNQRYAGRDHPVRDEDEVMLVPPIAGG